MQVVDDWLNMQYLQVDWQFHKGVKSTDCCLKCDELFNFYFSFVIDILEWDAKLFESR